MKKPSLILLIALLLLAGSRANGQNFDTIQQFGIDIDESAPFGALAGCSIAQLYSILIHDNDFESYFTTNHANPDGIIISGAPDAISGDPDTYQDDLRQDITVTNNVFEGAGTEEAGSIAAAIHFMDATGDIGYNTIGTSDNPGA